MIEQLAVIDDVRVCLLVLTKKMNGTFKTWRNFNNNLGVLFTAKSIIVPEINVAVFLVLVLRYICC